MYSHSGSHLGAQLTLHAAMASCQPLAVGWVLSCTGTFKAPIPSTLLLLLRLLSHLQPSTTSSLN